MDIRLQENLQGKQHDYMAPFLWLHGEDDALIIRELDRIYDCGIRSVCLESRTHEDFCEAEWWSDMRLIMDHCRNKGMGVWILDDKHFPSGYANNSFRLPENDHLRPWGITERHIDVSGPVTDGHAMVDCWKAAPEDEIVAVLACRHVPNESTYTEVINLTENLENGLVWFDLPRGDWRILMLIKTQGGLDDFSSHYCDMLRRESVKVFVDNVYEPHYAQLKEYFGDPFLGFFSDEPSFRNNMKNAFLTKIGDGYAHFPWHETLIPLLREKLGENWRSMLPGFWYDIGENSDKFRLAYMDIVTRLYSENYCAQLGKWCHDHGVEYIGHIIEDNHAHAMTGAGPGHYFRSLADQDMSGIDIVLHQIIPGLTETSSAGCLCYEHVNNDFFHYYLGKLASSLAHMDEKKKGRAMCEIFGAFGWAEGTRYMKYLADHMLVRGINYYVPHAFSPKPNDLDCPPNFYQSGENAQFKYFRNIMDYMNRVCHLHNGGIHVPTAALLYDAEAQWIGRDRLPLEKVGKELYDNLLDYDILPHEVLPQLDETGCLNGEAYPCLIVPYYEGIPESVLSSLFQVKIPLIVAVKPGMAVTEPWLKEHAAIVPVECLADYVRSNIGCDVTADYSGIFLRYYHYVRGCVHSYLFTTEDIHEPISATVRLSAFDGGSYILYDPMENKAYAGFSRDGSVEIRLHPYHSIMVFCGDVSVDNLPALTVPTYRELPLSPTYHISLREEKNPEFTPWKVTDKLFNVTGRKEMPNFSGNIRYEWKQTAAEKGRYQLDLGDVGEAAEVYINGVSVGRKLFAPYVFDISAMEPGENTVTVIVSNHSGYRERDGFSQYLHFEPSGLLGPVVLKQEAEETHHV